MPLSCPFYRDGVSYLRKLEHNVARYSLGPVAGLLALPPGGEAGALSDAEADEFLKLVGETAGKEKVLLAGVERASVAAALRRIEAAERNGFDAVLLAPPTDWVRLVRGSDARELLVFYEAVADRSPLPIVLWSDAAPPSVPLPVDAIVRLAGHSNVLGLVDADLTEARLADVLSGTASVRREVAVTMVFEAVTRRMLQPVLSEEAASGFVAAAALGAGAVATSGAPSPASAPPVLKTRSKAVGFQVLSGGPAHGVVPLLVAGATGAMPTLAACAPQACFEAYAAWKDGDLALAAERAGRLCAADALLERLGPAAVKVACDFNGYFGGVPRLPRLPLRAADREELELTLLHIRN